MRHYERLVEKIQNLLTAPSSAGPRKRGVWLAVAACGLLMLVTALVLTVFLGLFLGAALFRQRETVAPVAVGPVAEEPRPAPAISAAEPQREPVDPPGESRVRDLPPSRTGSQDATAAERDRGGGGVDVHGAAEAPPPNPLDSVASPLRLPPRIVWTGAGAFARPGLNSEVLELARLAPDDLSELSLELVGEEFARENNRVELQDAEGERIWRVMGDYGETVTEKPINIATFSLRGDTLWFGWEDGVPLAIDLRLDFCRLKLTVSGDEREFRREFPFHVETREKPSVTLAERSGSKVRVFVDEQNWLRHDDSLQVRLRFTGMEGSRFLQDRTTICWNERETVIEIPLESYADLSRDPKIYLKLRLLPESDGQGTATLHIEYALQTSRYLFRRQEYSQHWRYDSSKWSFERQRAMALSHASIEQHCNTVRQNFEGFKREFRSPIRFSGFGHSHEWIEEPAEQRDILLQYAEQYQDYVQLLQRTSRTMFRSRDLTAHANRLRNLEEQHEDIRPRVERYGLDTPEALDLARAFDFYANYLDHTERWAEAMRGFLEELSERGRLDFQLYVERDGRPIELARTEGF